jgi:hypothetical protein
MMKIPTAADSTPPLMAPLRTVVEEQESEIEISHANSGQDAPEQVSRWLLLAGVVMMLGIIGVGVVVSRSGKLPPVLPQKVMASAPVVTQPVVIPLEQRSQASILAELQPIATKFLSATTVDDCLPTVRNPEVAGPRMRAFYKNGVIAPQGMSRFNVGNQMEVLKQSVSVVILTADKTEKMMRFIQTEAGFKVVWEIWADWSELSWMTFLESKPAKEVNFRVRVSATEYYNFGYLDESKWQSYHLESPDGELSVYGYVEKGGALERAIVIDKDVTTAEMILSLKFTTGVASKGQVEIVKVVAESWIEP